VRVRDFQNALRLLDGAPAAIGAPVTSEVLKVKLGSPVGRGTVTASSLRVRKGPGTQFEKSGDALSKGASVIIYGEVNGWQCIGQGRWVSAQFIDVDKGPKSPAAQQGVDKYLEDIAQKVWEAMFGGTVIGTDEEKIYANLARLGHYRVLIDRFETIYRARFGSDVVDDLRSELSDNVFGNELTRALSYVLVPVTAVSPKGARPSTAGSTAAKSTAAVKTAGLDVRLIALMEELRADEKHGTKVVVTSTLREPADDARAVLRNQRKDADYYKIFAKRWQLAILAAVRDRDLSDKKMYEAAVADLTAWIVRTPGVSAHVEGRAADFGLAGGDPGFKAFVESRAAKRGFIFKDESEYGHYHVQISLDAT